VSLVATLALFTKTPHSALADQVVADDLIVQGNLCVGTSCADGETFPSNGIKVKSIVPRILFDDTDSPQSWAISANGGGFNIVDATSGISVISIAPSAPTAIVIDADAKVGVGTLSPSQKFHVRQNLDSNTFTLVQNSNPGLNAAAVTRTQSNVAMQNFQSHGSGRTLTRWGVALGGWNEFLAVQGNGLAMGTLANAPFILGTSAIPRMTFDGDSNFIDFAGGGQYDGNSFNDASSRVLKQDIQPLGPGAAAEALAALEPVTFAYRATPGDPRVGFVAEDVPGLVATPGRQTLSALEIVAVVTKVLQEQQRTVQEQQKVIAELTARLTALEARP
jgi:hypothetical protein